MKSPTLSIRQRRAALLFTVMSALSLGLAAHAQEAGGGENATSADTEPAVDPVALAIGKQAVDFLAEQKSFQVTAEVWEDEVIEGAKLQFSRVTRIALRRPDRLRLDISDDQPRRRFLYDGETVTVVDDRQGFHGTVEAPATIDEALAVAAEKYALTFVLDDLLVSQPFGGAAAEARSGQYLGLTPVLGQRCHHLAFQHASFDWQVWIEDGPTPLLRKIVITYKDVAGIPQFTAILNDWDFTTPIADSHFEFQDTGATTEIQIVAPPAEPEPEPESDSTESEDADDGDR